MAGPGSELGRPELFLVVRGVLVRRALDEFDDRALAVVAEARLGQLQDAAVAAGAVLGAFLDDAAGPDAGAAYAYELTSNPAPQVYCTAKTGLVCGVPSIRFAGSPSASTPHGFVVAAHPALPNRLGVMLYSARGRTATPFEGGLLCVKPPLQRSVAMTSAGPAPCDGVFSIDWNAFAHGLLGGTPAAFLLRAGQPVHLQVWGRDSVATGSYLSPGLEYFVCD